MTVIYEEVPLEEMEYESADKAFYYTCPCGDLFALTLNEMLSGDDIAKCPSCSLLIRVVFTPEDLKSFCTKEGIPMSQSQAVSVH